MLATINAHRRDSRISFDEPTHTYTIDGSSDGYKSTTTLVHSAFPTFEPDEVISNMLQSRGWATSIYNGMSREEIKKAWSENGAEASALGTAMHNNIEHYYNSEPYETSSKEWRLFTQFEGSHPDLKCYRTEMMVFDTEHKIAGSIDCLYRDPNNEGCFIIADWKRAKALKKENEWQGGLLDCTQHLDDCNLNTYSMQLHIYKFILERCYGMKVTQCFLVFLHPTQDDFLKVPCKDLSGEVKQLFAYRKAQLKEQELNKENIDSSAQEQ